MATDISLTAALTQVRAALNDDVVRFFQSTQPLGIYKTPFGETVRAEGFDFQATDRLFSIIYDSHADLNALSLEISRRNVVARQRAAQDRAFFSSIAIRERGIARGETQAPNFSERLGEILRNLASNDARRSKIDATALPSASNRPTLVQSFGTSLDGQTLDPNLTLALQQRISLGIGTDIDIAPLETTSPTTPPTHYFVRLSGSEERTNGASDDLVQAAGSLRILDASGNVQRVLDNNVAELITAAEFARLNFQATDRDFLQASIDYLSIVPVDKISPNPTLDPADNIGGLNTVIFSVQETLRVVTQPPEREYQATAFVESFSVFRRAEISFEGTFSTGTALDDYNAGLLRLVASEYGRPSAGNGSYQAVLNIAESSGNNIVFDFEDGQASDGAFIQARFLTPAGQISAITISFS